MSISYYITLYFPLERLECAIEELIKISERASEKRMSIWLQDGRKVVVPHTLYAVPDKNERSLATAKSISFTTSFLLAEDPVIYHYVESLSLGRESIKHMMIDEAYRIGNFIVSLTIGESYSEVSIGSVSSSQIRILSDSDIFHHHVVRILGQCDGLFALLNTDTQSAEGNYVYSMIGNLDKVVLIDPAASDFGDNIDFMVEMVVQQLSL